MEGLKCHSHRFPNVGSTPPLFSFTNGWSVNTDQSQQNREAIYRDAHRVKQQLEEGESRRSELQVKVEKLTVENAQLREQTEYNPFTDPDKVAQYAVQAQAEGVSLPVAHRLLKILRETKHLQ